ncbi:hypothetical protein [Salinicoccus sp. HZC-1]|uniref:hypothetical protein n=1 Tax=Salinicoccus sp. HZC-1 TaxID=3385497 RepID=UPI00398BB2BF
MRCGTKCFIITVEQENELITEEVPARSQVDARKIVRKRYGEGSTVKSVRRK